MLFWKKRLLVMNTSFSASHCFDFNHILFILESKLIIFLGDSDKGCLGKDYCPPPCTCTGTVVRCSRMNLTELPDNLPAETSELYVFYVFHFQINQLTHAHSIPFNF